MSDKRKAPKRKASTPAETDISPSKKVERPVSVFEGEVLDKDEKVRARDGYEGVLPTKNDRGNLVFEDREDFFPNLTPEEVLRAGSFGGTYFRPIKSSVTGLKYDKQWEELPQSWIKGMNIKKQIAKVEYEKSVNTYEVKCGGDLDMWESSGWIQKQDPYGWFQWYCRFYLGRRSKDDERQVKRWLNCAGLKGRWKNNLIGKIIKGGSVHNNYKVSPVIRQTLQHWGYKLTKEDFEARKKVLKKEGKL